MLCTMLSRRASSSFVHALGPAFRFEVLPEVLELEPPRVGGEELGVGDFSGVGPM